MFLVSSSKIDGHPVKPWTNAVNTSVGFLNCRERWSKISLASLALKSLDVKTLRGGVEEAPLSTRLASPRAVEVVGASLAAGAAGATRAIGAGGAAGAAGCVAGATRVAGAAWKILKS